MSAQPAFADDPTPDRRRIFLDQYDVVITDRYISTNRRRYELLALSQIVHSRGSLHEGVLVGLVIALVGALVTVPILVAYPTPATVASTLLGLVVPAAVAVFCQFRWPPRMALFAQHRGFPVLLFESRDETAFGRVRRALTRAREAAIYARDHRDGWDGADERWD
jgi:hypothetical protein